MRQKIMKHENWYNEEYMLKMRKEVVETATSLINNNIDFLTGIREINSLRHQVSNDDFDQDFIVFVAIDSETDHMPDYKLRASCSRSWLEKCDKEIKEIKELNQKQVLEACTKLVDRFKVNA